MMTSVGEIPTAAAQIYGNKTLLVCEDRSLTFSELDALSNRLAGALLDLGVQSVSYTHLTLPTTPYV